MMGRDKISERIGSAIEDMVEQCWRLSKMQQDGWIHQKVKEQTGYAILSHRWLSEGELTFQDMSRMMKQGDRVKVNDMSGTGWEATKRWFERMLEDETQVSHGGLIKLFKFCEVAWQQGCKYIWFDTGCINKENGVEVEESMRSMFSWYRNSAICIVHLNETTDMVTMRRDPWFTRGWTLQELLAPTKIQFFGKCWNKITDAPNDKISDLEAALWKDISEITVIPIPALLSFNPGTENIRQKMVWASKRETTRVEDMAYCLVGIFGVTLSIVYGEGRRAFYRLQLEIMRHINDNALFIWQGQPSVYNSMFAAAPDCFFATAWDSLFFAQRESLSSGDRTYLLANGALYMALSVYDASLVRQGNVGNEYRLEVQGLETLNVAIRDEPESNHVKIAILGDTSLSVSVIILLHFGPETQCRRIATENILTIKRPQQPKLAEMVVVV